MKTALVLGAIFVAFAIVGTLDFHTAIDMAGGAHPQATRLTLAGESP